MDLECRVTFSHYSSGNYYIKVDAFLGKSQFVSTFQIIDDS